MQNNVNVMGLEIDLVSAEKFTVLVREYLKNDCLNVVFFVNTNVVEMASKEEQYHDIIKLANLVLSGEETLLSLHHVDTLKVGSIIVDNSSIDLLFEEANKEIHTVFIMSKVEIEGESLKNHIEKKYTNLEVECICYDDLTQNTEVILNSINSIAPDILFLLDNSPKQEEWLMENKTKINSKLCISTENVARKIVEDEKPLPNWMYVTKMDKIYNMFKNLYNVRIFKKKVAHYIHKKGDNLDGNHD